MLDFKFPPHWDLIKMKYSFVEVSIKGYPNESLLVASQNMGVVPKEIYGQRTVVATKDLHLLKLVEVGNFVISLRSFQGGIEYAYYRGIISPAYTVLKSTGVYYEHYFRYLAKSAPFIDFLKTCVTGIREGQNIDYQVLKNKKLPVPPLDEQEKIVRYLDKKTAQISTFVESKKKQVELLDELKRAVISEAVTKNSPHWKLYRLKYIADNNVENLSEKLNGDTAIKYIDIGSVTFGKGITKIQDFLFKDAPSRARRIVHEGDTIISTVRTYLKAIAYIEKNFAGSIASTGFAVLTPRENIFPKFLYYAVRWC